MRKRGQSSSEVGLMGVQGAQGSARRKARRTRDPEITRRGAPGRLSLHRGLLALPQASGSSLKPHQDELCRGSRPRTEKRLKRNWIKPKYWGSEISGKVPAVDYEEVRTFIFTFLFVCFSFFFYCLSMGLFSTLSLK